MWPLQLVDNKQGCFSEPAPISFKRNQMQLAPMPDSQNIKKRMLVISIVPPHNDKGVRIVMYRHLVERSPFELHVASTAEFEENLLIHTHLKLPYPIWRLTKTRFLPFLSKWIRDYRNFIWTLRIPKALDECISSFKPDVILTLAETDLCHIAAKLAKKHDIPLVGLFLDWFPIMPPHYGHKYTRKILSRRYRQLYEKCDLAICTSDGMKEVLGEHPNSHVVYPMPGKHKIPDAIHPPKSGKFRLVYVGSVRNFYGRMLSSLIERLAKYDDLELIVVGGDADWPTEVLARAKQEGLYLGFMPPEKAAEVLKGADALLVVMSFEPEHERFMRTSFTTKFLDYAAFHKPIILWAPDYCTPMRVVKREGGALPILDPHPDGVIDALRAIQTDSDLRQRLAEEARNLNETTFNPDRLQDIFVSQINAITGK